MADSTAPLYLGTPGGMNSTGRPTSAQKPRNCLLVNTFQRKSDALSVFTRCLIDFTQKGGRPVELIQAEIDHRSRTRVVLLWCGAVCHSGDTRVLSWPMSAPRVL